LFNFQRFATDHYPRRPHQPVIIMPQSKHALLLPCFFVLSTLTACHTAPAPATATASDPAPANRFQPVIDAWVAQDAETPPPDDAVLFIGSSSIRLWKTLHEDFPQYDVIQRGFGGSTFADANLFIDNIVSPYDPAAIVVFEGTNDIASGKTGEQAFEDYKTFVGLIRDGQKSCDKPTPILFIGITPTESRWGHWPEMQIANELVREYAEEHDGLFYIDTVTRILDTAPEPGGPPSAELFRSDLLHLSPEGYALWVEIITPALEAVYSPTK
jgi:lysophospholipase L1-like esterase